MSAHFDGKPDVGGEYEYPRGWFMVATADEITADNITALRFFGAKYLAYRDDAGEIVILDGLCPHMGADIAAGGRICDESVVCPFHGWQYGKDGKCNNIPYAKRIPPRASLRRHPADEKSGLVFMWHDPEFGEPHYEVPARPEWDDPTWLRWEPETLTIQTHAREIIDNIADKAHFNPVHGSVVEEFWNKFEGHYATQFMSGGHETLAEAGVTLSSLAIYHGPGYLITELSGGMPSVMLVAHTPISTEEVRVWYGLLVDIQGDTSAEMMAMAQGYAVVGREAFFQDVAIWENKATINRPMLCDGDGQIMKARQWYSQFYNPRKIEESRAAAE